MSLSVICPLCQNAFKAPDHAVGKRVKCPDCAAAIVVSAPEAIVTPAVVQRTILEPQSQQGPPARVLAKTQLAPGQSGPREGKAEPQPASRPDDCRIPFCVGIGGLILLAVSPFLTWISVGGEGVKGMSADGPFLLGGTLLAVTACLAAALAGRWLSPVALVAETWGVVAAFWMATLVWRINSLAGMLQVKDSPLAALWVAQFHPGAGLYLGLAGGTVAACAMGVVAVRRLLPSGSLKSFYATQVLAIAAGVLAAAFAWRPMGPRADRPEQAHVEPVVTPTMDRAESAGLEVEIADVMLGKVPLRDLSRDGGVSEDDLLTIRLSLRVTDATRKVDYRSWADPGALDGGGRATLKDNFGNDYKQVGFGLGSRPVGAVRGSTSVYPGKPATEVLVFQPPVGTATYLELTLPAGNYGGEGALSFRIEKPRYDPAHKAFLDLMVRGRLELRRGHFADAADFFNSASKLFPGDARVQAGLAEADEGIAREKARKQAEARREKDREREEAKRLAEEQRLREEQRLALEKKALQQEYATQMSLGGEMMAGSRYPDAVAAFKKALAAKGGEDADASKGLKAAEQGLAARQAAEAVERQKASEELARRRAEEKRRQEEVRRKRQLELDEEQAAPLLRYARKLASETDFTSLYKAQERLQEIIKDYPATDAAAEAKEVLKQVEKKLGPG